MKMKEEKKDTVYMVFVMLQFRATMAGGKSIMDSLYGFMSQFVKMCLPVCIMFSLGKKINVQTTLGHN